MWGERVEKEVDSGEREGIDAGGDWHLRSLDLGSDQRKRNVCKAWLIWLVRKI